MKKLIIILIACAIIAPFFVSASTPSVEMPVESEHEGSTAPVSATETEQAEPAHESQEHEGGHGKFTIVFLLLAIIIIVSKIGGLVEKIGQPPVLGELIAGIVLGNIALFGWHFFDQIKHNEIIGFLSELGVVILLFQIGLESNIYKMKQVGMKAFVVAIIGVIAPFVLGAYIVGPMFFPGQDFNVYLFLGATLTATSVGITARVFKDLKKIKTKEAQIVLGAAVIDDVLGLVILAIVSAIVALGTVSLGEVGIITTKAVLFLVLSIVIGMLIAPILGKLFSKISTGAGMKMGLALAFGLTFAYLAGVVGLAPIVGAFAAGLVLDPVHFKWFKSPHFVSRIKKATKELKDSSVQKNIDTEIEHFRERHIEDLIEDVAHFLVPIFFVYTGMQVDLTTFADPSVIILALIVTAAAFVGKLVCGLGTGKGINRWIVGIGMAPRGEVGLIFAAVGLTLGVVTPSIYSVIVIMVILTTLIPPPILAALLKKLKPEKTE